jgi:hypothetical protein
MINTNPATLRSGQVWFQVGTANIGNTELFDMSELSYEFDLKSAETAINTFGVIPGSMTIKVADDTSTRNSVYDVLLAELPTSASNLSAKMYWLKHGESTPNTFPFQVTQTSIEYDGKSGLTTVQLLPPVQSTSNINAFLTAISASYGTRQILNESRIPPSAPQDTMFEGYFMGDVIEGFISQLDTSPGNSNIYRSGYDGTPSQFPPPGFGRTVDYEQGGANTYVGNTVYAFANLGAVVTNSGTQSIRAKITSVGAMEGAFFGSAFSVNFYTNRRSIRENVTLTNSDITEIKTVKGSQKVNSIALAINSGGASDAYFPTFDTELHTRAGNPLGDQTIALSLVSHAPHFTRGVLEFDATNSPPQYVNALPLSTGASGQWNTQNLAIAGTVVYSSAFDFSVEPATRIETTVLGVDSVKPYQVIKFDSSTPTRYQGKHYRPSSIKYDFKADTVTISAYRIP